MPGFMVKVKGERQKVKVAALLGASPFHLTLYVHIPRLPSTFTFYLLPFD